MARPVPDGGTPRVTGRGGDVTFVTCGADPQPLGSFTFLVPTENPAGTTHPNRAGRWHEVVRVEGDGPVYALGQFATNDPLIYCALRDWLHACAAENEKRFSRRHHSTATGGTPGGRVRLVVKGEPQPRLEAWDTGGAVGELVVRVFGSVTTNPTLVYGAFVGWLRAAALRHYEKEE